MQGGVCTTRRSSTVQEQVEDTQALAGRFVSVWASVCDPCSYPAVALTVLQCGSIDLAGGGPCPSPIESLDHHAILGKLLEVVQSVDLAVPGGLHLHDAVLPVAARTVFSVANLIAPDDTVLQLLLGCL